MSDDIIKLNLVLDENTARTVEGRVRNLVNRLNNSSISLNIGGTNLDNVVNKLNTVRNTMQTLNNMSVNINANLTSAQQQYRLETERIRALTEQRRIAQQITVERERTLQTENRAVQALAQENRTMTVNRNLTADINGNIQHTHEHIRDVNNATNDFVAGLGRSLQYILQYRVMSEILNQITEAYRELQSVDSAMVGYRKVTGASKADVASLTKEAFSNAAKYGRLASEYAESTERFAKAGYNNKSSELSELALLAEGVGDIDNELANEFLIAADASWKLNGNVAELTKILDMFNELSNRTATDVGKLSAGITVSGSMFAQAGLSAQDYAAIVGTVTSKTARSGEEMGRAWRTIIMNLSQIRGTDIETGEIIDEEKLAKAEKTLNGVGIQIREVVNGQNELRNPMKILAEIADKWENLSSIQQSALSESISGKRQNNAFISVIENWKDVEKAIEITSQSSNSAMREHEIYMDSWSAKQKQTTAEWSEFVSHMSNVETIKGTLDVLSAVINTLDTPIGRIVVQATLMNTAFALTGRLFGALRTRSIVADILAMGVAERDLGTAIELVNGHLLEQARAWMTSPSGIASMVTIAISAISMINSAIEEYKQKLREAAEEASKQAEESANNVQTLLEFKTQLDEGTKSSDELTSAFREQMRVMGKTETEIDSLIAKYGGLAGAIREATREALERAKIDAHTDVATSSKSLKDTYESGWYGDTASTVRYGEFDSIGSELRDKIYEIMSPVAIDSDSLYSSITWGAKSESAEGIYEYYQGLQQVVQLIQDTASKTNNEALLDSSAYKQASEALKELKESANLYGDAINRLHTADAQIEFSDYLKSNDIDTKETFDEYINGVKNNIEYSETYKEVLISIANDAFPQLSNAAKDAGEKTNEAIITLDNLTKASEGISSLQKAFKELSDDGYITTDTISKIKEAVGDSVTNWDEYENILLTAKAGSEDFNQALSDLTYTILENEFGTDGLANATEEQIAAVLRENGVLEANKVAIDVLTKAKVAQAVSSYNGTEESKSFAEELINESLAGDAAKLALEQLNLAIKIYDSDTINSSDDVDALIAEANAANATAASIERLYKVKSLLEKAESSKSTYWADYYNNEAKKLLAEGVDFKLLDPNDFKFDLTSSSKNEALDNALKQAERLYKVHQNELEYIKDLESVSANYAKTEEERLEIQDKIAEARKDYAQNQIEDIEHQIELLQNLEGEEANVVEYYKSIQNIVSTEAERLRKLGYDNNSSEIQELQKQWWDAKQAIDEYRKSLLETRISNYEHDIFLLEKNEADSQKILEIYRKMQEEIHAEVEYYRSLGIAENDERIQELQKQWWEYQDNIEEVKEKILSDIEEMVAEANDLLDGFQDVYTTLTDAAKEYNSTGYLSVDSLQSILELSPKYLGFLYDENGQLVLNEQALQNVIAAQTEEMAVQNALAYAKQILNAAEQNDIETLTTLTQITTEGSNATWDMAYATLALAKAVGTANGMDSGYFDSAVSYIDKMQSLSKIAVNSISSYYKTLDEGYISQKDALDQILDLTQDLIKWEQEQLIESLEKQKEDYQEIIDKKKEMLQLTKEESDHEKSVAEKLQEIAKLQSRIEQLSLDDSREAQAQKKGLEEELNELQKELADDQADYAIDVQIDALDKELEAFEDAKDDEIKAQKEMLDSAEELYQAAISRIENDWDGLYQDLLAWNAEYGSTLQSDLVNAWDAASAAVQRYGSFVEAYANADNYTDIGGSSSGSGIASGGSASSIVSAMKQNSLNWFTATDSSERSNIEKVQQTLRQQYESVTGEKLTQNTQKGIWEKSDGTALYTLDKDTVAKHVVNQMETNSKLWKQTNNESSRKELERVNEYLHQTLEDYLGKSITKDGNGVWWIDGKKLFDVYHTGGIVGNNPTLKQNEAMAVLEEGEMVLTKEHQNQLSHLISFAEVLDMRKDKSTDMTAFTTTFTHPIGGIDASRIPQSNNINNHEEINFNPEITVTINHSGAMSDSDLKRYGNTIADATLDKLKESFSRRGVSTIGNAMLK